MSASVRTVLETRRHTNDYGVTRDYKLINKSAGIEPAGAGTRETKEAWGVLFNQHGAMHGRWFTNEADARDLLAKWAPNHG